MNCLVKSSTWGGANKGAIQNRLGSSGRAIHAHYVKKGERGRGYHWPLGSGRRRLRQSGAPLLPGKCVGGGQ